MQKLTKIGLRQRAFRAAVAALNLAKVNTQTKETLLQAAQEPISTLNMAFFNRLQDRAANGQLVPRLERHTPEFRQQLNATLKEVLRICVICCDNCDHSQERLRQLAECLAQVLKKVKDYYRLYNLTHAYKLN